MLKPPSSSTISWFTTIMTAIAFGITLTEVALLVFYPNNKYFMLLVNASLLVIGVVLVVEGVSRGLKWK
jgi:hypothetical protein